MLSREVCERCKKAMDGSTGDPYDSSFNERAFRVNWDSGYVWCPLSYSMFRADDLRGLGWNSIRDAAHDRCPCLLEHLVECAADVRKA